MEEEALLTRQSVDWHWQLRNRISTLEELKQIINLTYEEKQGIEQERLLMAITPYFASLMDKFDPHCPIRKQVIPSPDEAIVSPFAMEDPLHEDKQSPVPCLVHRYPDRVLLLSTDMCASYCRYCTRERLVGDREVVISDEKLDKICSYIRKNKQIRDVLISGGDPLLIETPKLENIIKKIRQIEHVEIVRIGTKVPVVLPYRIDDELVSMLKKYHPLYISIHFTHPKEITPEVKEACDKLNNAGIPLGSQTVLLKGINNDAIILKKLFHELLKIRVKPYYLYQCDLVRGTSHFWTPVSEGIKIIEQLRGFTSGYAIPDFVIDVPGGGGKIAIAPNNIVESQKNRILLKNYTGKIFEYPTS